jgi:hypothetical protein
MTEKLYGLDDIPETVVVKIVWHQGLKKYLVELWEKERITGFACAVSCLADLGYAVVPIAPTPEMIRACWKDQYLYVGGSEEEAERLASARVADPTQLKQDTSAYIAMIEAGRLR